MRHSAALIAILASALLPRSASAVLDQWVPPTPTLFMLAAHSPATQIFSTANDWRFDGSWYVVVFCPEAAGAHAYAYRMTAAVKDGMLHGERGEPGTGGWMALDGAIQPDGSARLTASGITSDADEVLGIAPSEKRYVYVVAARFQGPHGLGSEVEGRACNLHFTRR
jgi:hypothetical protein